MGERYKISEVEEMLGVTRATIRHYIDKGLLDVKKDEKNGYRYYDRQNILDLLEIIYRRNALDLSLGDIFECLRAESLADCRTVCDHQRQLITGRIHREETCLAILDIFDQILTRLSRYLDHITVIHYPAFYYYPQNYVFNTRSTVFLAGYQSSEFVQTNGKAAYRGLCSLVDEKDLDLLADNEKTSYERKISSGEFVYSAFCSELDREDPTLLEPALHWAQEQGIYLLEALYLCHLFTIKKDGRRYHYYECFLPLATDARFPSSSHTMQEE